MRNTFRALMLTPLVLFVASSALGQTTTPPTRKPVAPGMIKLTGDDEKRAKQLDEAIEDAMKADRWDEAIARATELLALRARVQGAKHFETVNAEWQLKALRLLAPMPKQDRASYQSARAMNEQAIALVAKGEHALAQPLLKKALEIGRRLLTDDHRDTATRYNNVAQNLLAQGKYGAAQPLLEKALEIRRRVLTDDHPDTAGSYFNLASNLTSQERYLAAQGLFEKALGLQRRLLTDSCPETARSYHALANVLAHQGKHTEAQPLYKKALELRLRTLGRSSAGRPERG